MKDRGEDNMITRNELYRLRLQLGQLGPEKWDVSRGNAQLSVCRDGDGDRLMVANCATHRVAEHVAMFDPAMCLRLVNEIEALQRGQLPEAA